MDHLLTRLRFSFLQKEILRKNTSLFSLVEVMIETDNGKIIALGNRILIRIIKIQVIFI